ncbi:mitochondrial protein [Spathaspora passalidarum NRRL Y-27907]|uniref:Respiratory supercomplex factor 1, mitochondrial n=1 Tax=Spathaspora passalidarum (strain NRRL Y-27907 / 11-Y1) TaxID=619300 RepID=G3APQ4_SPAPN|nr:mitochondrial protein [Spathaspora passalidarum NRRL Y-27907]EGW32224.1 mitochondrial protein [Spathaspora passalidarum NRRL Y-27907]
MSTRLPSSVSFDEEEEEDFFKKIWARCKENPFVPAGTLATTGAITLAAFSMHKGNRKKTNIYYRYRVLFQGLTLVALVVGGLFFQKEAQGSQKSKEDLLREKAKKREQLWIEELERRDAIIQARKLRLQQSKDELRELAREEFEKERLLEDTEKKQ